MFVTFTQAAGLLAKISKMRAFAYFLNQNHGCLLGNGSTANRQADLQDSLSRRPENLSN